MSKATTYLAAMLASLVAFCLLSAALQQNDTWSIIFDDPNRGGTQTTTITVSYIDSAGVKKEKEISATVSITADDSSASKKTKVQNALNSELSKPANGVNGTPLASTSGSGGVMTVTPAANSSGNFSDAKIKDVETEDKDTGEKDKIIKPTGKEGLGQVSFEGELVGQTSGNLPSVFEVDTNLGTASVPLAPGMTRLQVLKSLSEQLNAMGPKVVTWIDSERLVLFVLLKEEGIYTIGAGSTDDGLAAICKVVASN
jgi:hypothetical protein